MQYIGVDYFTYDGARNLKHRIEAFWQRRGLYPAVQIAKQFVGSEGRLIYVIRSDLVMPVQGSPYIKRTAQR